MNQELQKFNSADQKIPAGFKPLKIDQALTALRKVPSFSGSIRAFFDAESLGEMTDLFTSDRVVEIDALFISWQLTGEEFVQYMSLLPQFEEIRADILAMAERIIERMRPRFINIVKASIKNDRRGNLFFVHNQILRLLNAMVAEVGTPFRMMVVDELRDLLLILLFREIRKEFLEPEYKKHFKVYVETRKELYRHWKANTGNDYPPSAYHTVTRGVELCLSHNRFSTNLHKAFPPLNLSPEEKDQLELELASQFEEIRELQKYRKVLFTPWECGETKVAIMGDDVTRVPGSRRTVSEGMIVLNPLEDLELPKLEVKKNDREFLIMRQRDGVINFSVHRRTGELCFFGASAFSLRNLIPEPTYLAIKKRIYSMLLDQLRGKEPDIEDLFAKFEVPVAGRGENLEHEDLEQENHDTADQEIISEIQDLAGEASIPEEEKACERVCDHTADEVEGTLAEEEAVAETNGVEQKIPTEEATAEEITAEMKLRRQRFQYLQRLKNLKAREILPALKRLFQVDKHLRVDGSHFKFKSPRNGVVAHFPIHFSEEVGFFCIKMSLERMGYSLEEFCEEIR